MIEVDDHNAPRWLVVRYLPEVKSGDQGAAGHLQPAGWYVVRICRCCYGERVCRFPYPDEAEAERVRELLLTMAS